MGLLNSHKTKSDKTQIRVEIPILNVNGNVKGMMKDCMFNIKNSCTNCCGYLFTLVQACM